MPRPVATISDTPVDSENPFSSSITVLNAGLLPLHNVSVSVAVQEITGDGTLPTVNIEGQPGFSSWVHPKSWVPRELWLDDRFTIAFDQFMDFPSKALAKADIAVVVE